MRQKYKKYDFVHCVEHDKHFALFGDEFDAIVEYSCYEEYGYENSENEYSLFIIKGDKVVANASWYDEDWLTFIKRDINLAKTMIEEYKKTIESDDEP